MRVITGTAKGSRLKAPPGLRTRPMLDRVKESLFSILDGYGAIRGYVLDLYAGSGALGIECLSRGAEHATFVEQRSNVCRVIQHNLEHTKMQGRGHVYCLPVDRYLRHVAQGTTYDIIIMDPPYADPHIEDTIAYITASHIGHSEGLIVVGHSPRVELAEAYGSYQRIRFRRLGDSCFSMYEQVDQTHD